MSLGYEPTSGAGIYTRIFVFTSDFLIGSGIVRLYYGLIVGFTTIKFSALTLVNVYG